MKRLLLLSGVVGLLLVGVASPALAAPRDASIAASGGLQKARGGLQTADVVVSGSSEHVTGIMIDCGGSACTASIYDATVLGEDTNANGTAEFGAAANESKFIPFDPPLRHANGVLLNVDANVDAVVIYTIQATP